jgi:ribosomal protein S18 acetylase RimI-like enzyme
VEDSKYDSKFGLPYRVEPVWIPQTIDKFVDLKHYCKLFTAEINNVICGLVWYVEYSNNESKTKIGRVRAIVVDKEHRGIGISSKLMDLMKKWVKKNRSVTHLSVGVYHNNDIAKHLYNKFGFKPMSQNMICKL